jgi:hypothetical protein
MKKTCSVLQDIQLVKSLLDVSLKRQHLPMLLFLYTTKVLYRKEHEKLVVISNAHWFRIR